MTTVALDMMGGDRGIEVTVPAALEVIRNQGDLNLVLVGPHDVIVEKLKGEASHPRLRVHNATEVVEMDEAPAKALRTKKDSSMRVALNLVRAGEADACVSAGNTGALMATARFVLKTLPGIDRPAIATALPRSNGHVHVLDLGANVDSPAPLLLQFGVMASILVQTLEGKAAPSVGLLNIGVEDIKGNDTVREASDLFRQSRLNYMGYVEGDEIFNGSVDIIVCDGFAGNVALKTAEGLAQMIGTIMKEEFGRTLLSRVSGALAIPVMKSFRTRVDHRRYNGAVLLGLRGVVVKSHGDADELGFAKAIGVATAAVERKIVENIGAELALTAGTA